MGRTRPQADTVMQDPEALCHPRAGRGIASRAPRHPESPGDSRYDWRRWGSPCYRETQYARAPALKTAPTREIDIGFRRAKRLPGPETSNLSLNRNEAQISAANEFGDGDRISCTSEIL